MPYFLSLFSYSFRLYIGVPGGTFRLYIGVPGGTFRLVVFLGKKVKNGVVLHFFFAYIEKKLYLCRLN